MILAYPLCSAILNVVITKWHPFKVVLGLEHHWWPTFEAQFKLYLSRLELIFSRKPKPFLTSSSNWKPWNSVARVISTHMEAKGVSGAMGQGRTELFFHLASPRATSQEIQPLDGPPKSNSHFQRDPCCVYTHMYIISQQETGILDKATGGTCECCVLPVPICVPGTCMCVV